MYTRFCSGAGASPLPVHQSEIVPEVLSKEEAILPRVPCLVSILECEKPSKRVNAHRDDAALVELNAALVTAVSSMTFASAGSESVGQTH